ncbi:MAG: carbohydrate ABC transporter permease, partial [Proteobacteria bacterium]|nr:carbohydrate ABC transporter permease [Pseudomonadota bacterium]
MSKRARNILTWIGTFIIMLIICLPGLWVILSAFRSNGEILTRPAVWIPERLSLDNFRSIFGYGENVVAIPVGSYFTNSLIISLTSTAIAVAIGMAGGYAFARFRFPGKSQAFLWFMLSRTVPGIALSLPIFILWSWMDIIDTKFGVILVYTAINVPFTIWLTEGFFRQIPRDLNEAAQIDGCTPWQAFWRVEFPLAKAGIASSGIFAFLTSWNEYALASQLTRSTDSKTLPVGLMDFTAQFTIDWAGMCAMAVIII